MAAMMTISFCVNLVVLALVVPKVWVGATGMDAASGPDAPARRILTCVYAAIWCASLLGLVLLVGGRMPEAVSLAIGLLSVQVIYKLMTVWAVGLANPVVMTNVPIAVLHSVTLVVILARP